MSKATESKPILTLRRTHELVASGWTRLTYARSANGEPCSALSSGAVCWCLSGALSRAAYEIASNDDGRCTRVARKYVEQITGMPFGTWNDAPGRTKPEVLAVLDAAIDRAIQVASQEEGRR